MPNIQDLSARFHINAEEKDGGGNFPVFSERIKGKSVCLLCDENTINFTSDILYCLKQNDNKCSLYVYPEREPVADEGAIEAALSAGKNADYLLAVGAGTLNDIAKYAGFLSGKQSGILATAPSMDGFSSSVTPLIEKGFKITRPAQAASDILLDYDILTKAPALMTGAGVGDILAKFCSLTDWKLSCALTGEAYCEEAATLMQSALDACNGSIPSIARGDKKGVSDLMNALLVSGYAMVIAGNSRPASGAEHHMSHYLEMDFLKRGERIPLHGVKVGLGTMVSLRLYKNVLEKGYDFDGAEAVAPLAAALPEPAYVRDVLRTFGCPTRFSELGVSRDTVYRMLFEAYKIRDRFTIMTLYNRQGLMQGAAEEILEEFY